MVEIGADLIVVKDILAHANINIPMCYNTNKIDEKLKDIKVCDPAIGSGAFPVSIMTEITKASIL